MIYRFSTERLDLEAAGAEHVMAEMDSPGLLGRLLQAEVEEGWPPGEYDRGAQEFFLQRLQEEGPEAVGWYGWYIVRRADGELGATLVAAAGYFGPPNERGEVEIGYSVMPQHQNKGYAREIVGALVEIAFSDPRVKCVNARTSPDNRASQRVLEHTGFSCLGPVDGENLLLYELRRWKCPQFDVSGV